MPVPGVNGTMSLMGAWLLVSTVAGEPCAMALDAAKIRASKVSELWSVKLRRFMIQLFQFGKNTTGHGRAKTTTMPNKTMLSVTVSFKNATA